MTVGSIISTASFLTGNTELSKKISDCLSGNDVLTKEESAEVEKLIKCYNVTVSELSEEYFPLLKRENVRLKNGKFYYKDLKKDALEIKNVFFDGEPISFKVYTEYFTADKDEVEVEYVFRCKNKNRLTDECEYDGKDVSERIIAEGVVSEWLMNAGMFDEAISRRAKYVNSLKNVMLKRKVGKIKARGWY